VEPKSPSTPWPDLTSRLLKKNVIPEDLAVAWEYHEHNSIKGRGRDPVKWDMLCGTSWRQRLKKSKTNL